MKLCWGSGSGASTTITGAGGGLERGVAPDLELAAGTGHDEVGKAGVAGGVGALLGGEGVADEAVGIEGPEGPAEERGGVHKALQIDVHGLGKALVARLGDEHLAGLEVDLLAEEEALDPDGDGSLDAGDLEELARLVGHEGGALGRDGVVLGVDLGGGAEEAPGVAGDEHDALVQIDGVPVAPHLQARARPGAHRALVGIELNLGVRSGEEGLVSPELRTLADIDLALGEIDLGRPGG